MTPARLEVLLTIAKDCREAAPSAGFEGSVPFFMAADAIRELVDAYTTLVESGKQSSAEAGRRLTALEEAGDALARVADDLDETGATYDDLDSAIEGWRTLRAQMESE